MESMFENTPLDVINVSHFNVSSVTNMNNMFKGTNIKALDLFGWTPANENSANNIAFGMNSLEDIRIGDKMKFNSVGISGDWMPVESTGPKETTINLDFKPSEKNVYELVKKDKKRSITDLIDLPTNIDGLFLKGVISFDLAFSKPNEIILEDMDSNPLLDMVNFNKGKWTLKKNSEKKFQVKFNENYKISKQPVKNSNITVDVEVFNELNDSGETTFTIKSISNNNYSFEQGPHKGKISYADGKFKLTPINDIKITKKTSTGGSSSSTSSTPDKTPSTNQKPTDKIKNIIHKLTTLFHRRHIKLYNRDFKESTDRSLSAGSDWYSDQTIEHDGKIYYRVSKNEYVAAEDIYSYEDKDVVNSQGKMSNRRLAKGTPWKSDRTIEINGKTYYRVSTDEFVSADDVVVR